MVLKINRKKDFSIMDSDFEERFKALTKMRGRRRIKRYQVQFRNLSDEAKNLFLEVNTIRMYKESTCTPEDFEVLVNLGYKTLRELNDARIDYKQIIEFGLRKDYIPILKRLLRPNFKPTEEMLEVFQSGSLEELESLERQINKYYYRKSELVSK